MPVRLEKLNDRIEIYHGDCSDIIPTLNQKFDAIITDVPYGEVNRESKGLRVLDKGIADSSEINLTTILPLLDNILLGSIYMFCGFQQYSGIETFLRENNYSTRCIIWEKTNPSPMNCKPLGVSGIELCAYGKKPKATYNGGYENTVLRYPVERSKVHTTQKNLKLIMHLIQKSTNEGDIVLDPYLGSGTTAEACIKLNRRCVGIEKEKKYFDIAKERLENALSQPMLPEVRNEI